MGRISLNEEFYSNKVIKKTKKKQNPMAKDLRTLKYKQRTVKSKKIYNRKKKSIT